MYLISLYFDMETDKTLSSIMANVAGITGNTHMIETYLYQDPQNKHKMYSWEDTFMGKYFLVL